MMPETAAATPADLGHSSSNMRRMFPNSTMVHGGLGMVRFVPGGPEGALAQAALFGGVPDEPAARDSDLDPESETVVMVPR